MISIFVIVLFQKRRVDGIETGDNFCNAIHGGGGGGGGARANGGGGGGARTLMQTRYGRTMDLAGRFICLTITITICIINPSGKLKLSFDRTTKNISQ